MNKIYTRTLSLVLLTALTAGTLYATQKHGHSSHYADMHAKHHGDPEASTEHMHDRVNMPGLQGKDTSQHEVNDLKTLFQKHTHIKRKVVNLSNGIQTTTESSNQDVQKAIMSHVSMMVGRLEAGRNPEVIIQSPTLDALFEVHNQIKTNIKSTSDGVVVTQTSDNPKVVALLQQHAAEVSDMSARGMRSVHERMAGQ